MSVCQQDSIIIDGYGAPGLKEQLAVSCHPHTLPYTGYDVLLVLGIGIALLVLALILRRLTKPKP